MARLFDLSAAFQPSTSQSGYSRWHFWEIFRPQDSPVFLMLLRPNSKVGYGITEEAKLDRQSDRKTNESSLVFRHCSLFLNLAQMLRFKTKLVAVIFSQQFLKRCHLVGVEVRVCESVRMCVFVRCVKWVLYRVFAGVYVQVPICGEAEGFTECVHACVCVHLIGELGGWVRVWHGVEPQESDLCPSSHSSIHRPGVRLSALSIILALCGIPRIPRPPLLRPRCDAAVSHLVQDQIRGHGAWQQCIWLWGALAVNRSFCSALRCWRKQRIGCIVRTKGGNLDRALHGSPEACRCLHVAKCPHRLLPGWGLLCVSLYLDHPSPQVIMLISVWSDD